MSDFVQLATPWLFHDNNASSFPHELLQCVSSMKNLHVDLLRASELTFATFIWLLPFWYTVFVKFDKL